MVVHRIAGITQTHDATCPEENVGAMEEGIVSHNHMANIWAHQVAQRRGWAGRDPDDEKAMGREGSNIDQRVLGFELDGRLE